MPAWGGDRRSEPVAQFTAARNMQDPIDRDCDQSPCCRPFESIEIQYGQWVVWLYACIIDTTYSISISIVLVSRYCVIHYYRYRYPCRYRYHDSLSPKVASSWIQACSSHVFEYYEGLPESGPAYCNFIIGESISIRDSWAAPQAGPHGGSALDGTAIVVTGRRPQLAPGRDRST